MSSKKKLVGYLAADGFVENLKKEFKNIHSCHERLVLSEEKVAAHWAENIWHHAEFIEFSSISEAAKKLKAIQRNWALYSFTSHRRAQLIKEQLPHVSSKPLKFPAELPTAALGSWTLIGNNTLLFSASCSSPFPNGEVHFEENKTEPPSRAYLKLWEALTLIQKYPKNGETCLDAGSSPGGWTWVISELGANVLSVDKAPLADSLMKKKNIKFIKGNFSDITPDKYEKFDWVFSDVICYPDKLYEWAKHWVDSKKAKNIICTIKFQGDKHYGAIKDFAAIKGSKLVHLYNNKHEVCWIYST